MATYFNVSEKQWVKLGLPQHAYKAIKAKGFKIIWDAGGGFAFQDKTDTKWGFAKVKGEEVTPNHIFSTKYKEIVGAPIVINKDQSLKEQLVASYKNPGLKKPADLSENQQQQVLHGKNLSNVEDVDVWVKGTDSPYRVYMISDDANIAYRFKGGQMAVRAERMTPTAKKALQTWGFNVKKAGDGREYASAHLAVTSEELARRTLGSVVASILSGPPKKLLSKEKVTA